MKRRGKRTQRDAARIVLEAPTSRGRAEGRASADMFPALYRIQTHEDILRSTTCLLISFHFHLLISRQREIKLEICRLYIPNVHSC